jgi:AcrR family transcriptional regulator
MSEEARARLFDAMLLELAENGYAQMTVEGALRRAGVSRGDFDAEFVDADACLFAAFEQFGARLVAKATEACDDDEEWPEGIRRGLEALLGELAAHPQLAHVAVRAFPAIRPAAYARYMALLESFAPFFTPGRSFEGVPEGLPAHVEMLAVGAAEAIVFDEVEAGRVEDLPGMAPAILFSVLVPFLGPERASVAMGDAKRGRRRS